MTHRMRSGAHLAAGVTSAIVAMGCSLDWGRLDPRLEAGSGGQGTGGIAATGGGGSSGASDGGGGATATGGTGGTASGTGGMGGTASGTGGTGGVPEIGCSDGTRELFDDPVADPDIAGCTGAWNVAGLATAESMTPACNREAGNDGVNSAGTGCSAEDLCAAGWTVCPSAEDVAKHAADGACPATGPSGLWATRQGGGNDGRCNAGSLDDVTGCGYVLGLATNASCAPLNRQFNYQACVDAAGWDCGDSTSSASELEAVTKPTIADGGVLCCKQ